MICSIRFHSSNLFLSEFQMGDKLHPSRALDMNARSLQNQTRSATTVNAPTVVIVSTIESNRWVDLPHLISLTIQTKRASESSTAMDKVKWGLDLLNKGEDHEKAGQLYDSYQCYMNGLSALVPNIQGKEAFLSVCYPILDYNSWTEQYPNLAINVEILKSKQSYNNSHPRRCNEGNGKRRRKQVYGQMRAIETILRIQSRTVSNYVTYFCWIISLSPLSLDILIFRFRFLSLVARVERYILETGHRPSQVIYFPPQQQQQYQQHQR